MVMLMTSNSRHGSKQDQCVVALLVGGVGSYCFSFAHRVASTVVLMSNDVTCAINCVVVVVACRSCSVVPVDQEVANGVCFVAPRIECNSQ